MNMLCMRMHVCIWCVYIYVYIRVYTLITMTLSIDQAIYVSISLFMCVRAYVCVYTRGLKCSYVLVMTCFLLRGYNILPKKELH